jgi:predicted dehydrogenase
MEKKIGIGVIGVGTWGEIHVKVYAKHPMVELRGIADVNEKRVKEIAEKYNVKTYTTDYNILLEDKNINAVSIATPDFLHREPTIAAAKAGKHILIEKPLATSTEDAKKIVEACKKANVKLMVDFHNRWNPPFVVAKEIISKEEIGNPIYAYVRLNDTIYVPTEMIKWSEKSAVIWFIGSHAIDTLRWILNDEVTKVYAVSRSEVLASKGINTPDVYLAILHFKSGVKAIFENSWIIPNSSPNIFDFKVNIIGSRGAIYIDTSHNRCIEKVTEKKYSFPDVLCCYSIYDKPLGFAVESINHFIECIINDWHPMPSGEDGLTVCKVISAIINSAKEGKVMEV